MVNALLGKVNGNKLMFNMKYILYELYSVNVLSL